ncbi:unnamed protein product [Spirodela intermedia]|uniref:EF-hand domain-containing protein n=1 Tax=Spirodela intermedia TaxID=51605 RepID=A0ABN7EBG2_SPIIN|nr:unnamed protein product [Spirodela intermedia]
MAAGGAATSFPRPLKWLSRLSLPRRRHLNPSPTVTSPVNGITAAVGCGGNCGFSEAFRRFDANGDGKISGEELLSFLLSAGRTWESRTCLSQRKGAGSSRRRAAPGSSPPGGDGVSRECAAMIRAFDGDGDGVLNYDEFCKMMM